jgi:hypothetical protein
MTFRADAALAARVDEAAEAAGVTRSDILVRLVTAGLESGGVDVDAVRADVRLAREQAVVIRARLMHALTAELAAIEASPSQGARSVIPRS